MSKREDSAILDQDAIIRNIEILGEAAYSWGKQMLSYVKT